MSQSFRPLRKQLKIPGILGGLGPASHIELEKRLLQKSLDLGVSCEADYPVWILMSATDIPERTESFKHNRQACSRAITYYSNKLQQAGASFLAVPCNTAHIFHDDVQATLEIPWIDLIEITVAYILHQYPNSHRVGLLATSGTIESNLYQKKLNKYGLTSIVASVNSDIQASIMKAVFHPKWGIKVTGMQTSPEALAELYKAINWIEDRGIDLIIAGCTELAFALPKLNRPMTSWVDPLDVMAEVIIALAYGHRSPYVVDGSNSLPSVT